jgi:hypothetical protein
MGFDLVCRGKGSSNVLYVMLLPNLARRRPPAVGTGVRVHGIKLRRSGGMYGAVGSQQCCGPVCGKVPYRLTRGFRPVRRFQPLEVDSNGGDRLKGPYKHKSFEFLRPSIEAGLRKRKKEGFDLIFGFVQSGCTGSPRGGDECFRGVSERVQLQK